MCHVIRARSNYRFVQLVDRNEFADAIGFKRYSFQRGKLVMLEEKSEKPIPQVISSVRGDYLLSVRPHNWNDLKRYVTFGIRLADGEEVEVVRELLRGFVVEPFGLTNLRENPDRLPVCFAQESVLLGDGVRVGVSGFYILSPQAIRDLRSLLRHYTDPFTTELRDALAYILKRPVYRPENWAKILTEVKRNEN